MNIVVNGRFSQYKTGIGRVIENHFKYLADIDTRNSYYIYVNPEFVDLFKFDNPNFHVLSNNVPAGNSLKNHLWTQTGFLRSIKKHQADLVILPQINLFVIKLAPTILFQYDMIECHVSNQKWYKMLFRRFAIPAAIKRADRIISISESTTRDIRQILSVPEDKLVTIPCGADLPNTDQAFSNDAAQRVRDKYKIVGDYILYVGTLTLPQKNLIRLVEAYKQLRDAGCKAKLVLVGARGKDAHLIFERIEALQLVEHVIFPGYVADEDLPALYANARVFCFPSLYEGFGLPIAEAMACGAAVVTSNTSSMPEVAGDAALLVDPCNVSELAEALGKVINDDALRDSMIEKGRERAKMFSWAAAARQLLDVINVFDKSAGK